MLTRTELVRHIRDFAKNTNKLPVWKSSGVVSFSCQLAPRFISACEVKYSEKYLNSEKPILNLFFIQTTNWKWLGLYSIKNRTTLSVLDLIITKINVCEVMGIRCHNQRSLPLYTLRCTGRFQAIRPIWEFPRNWSLAWFRYSGSFWSYRAPWLLLDARQRSSYWFWKHLLVRTAASSTIDSNLWFLVTKMDTLLILVSNIARHIWVPAMSSLTSHGKMVYAFACNEPCYPNYETPLTWTVRKSEAGDLTHITAATCAPIPNSPGVSFCRMNSGADLRRIIAIAKSEIFEPQVMIQMSKMAVTCAGQYLQDVHQDFGVFLKKLIAQLGWAGRS